MGIQRRMNGDTAAAATAFLNCGKAAVARLGQLSLPVRARVRAGNIVMGGVCGYYGSASAVSHAECETVEAVWRAHLARFAGRARGSPRCDVYGDNRREHIYSVTASSLLHSVFKIVRDALDTAARRIVRSELARTLYLLGCRTDPLCWETGHLTEALRSRLAAPRGQRPLFEQLVLVWSEATQGVCGLAEYRGPEGNPLLPGHPFWSGHSSTALFEPRSRGGWYGASFTYELVAAGIVSLDDIRGGAPAADGILDFEALRRRWPCVRDAKPLKEAYARVVDVVRAATAQGHALSPYRCRPHISPSDICSGQTRFSPEGAAAAHQNLRGSGVTGACGADPDIRDAWTELVLKDLRGDAAERTSAVRLSAMLRVGFGGVEPAGLARYPHGGDARARLQRSAQVFAWLPKGHFRGAVSVLEDPVLALPLSGTAAAYSIDSEGFVIAGAIPVRSAAAADVLCRGSAVACLFAKARIALGDVPVYADAYAHSLPRADGKEETAVCIAATQASFGFLLLAERACDTRAAWTVDGSVRPAAGDTAGLAGFAGCRQPALRDHLCFKDRVHTTNFDRQPWNSHGVFLRCGGCCPGHSSSTGTRRPIHGSL